MKTPAIRWAAGIVLVLCGLISAMAALCAAGIPILPSVREDYLQDNFYLMQFGLRLLPPMAFVAVSAAGVMGLSNPARRTKLVERLALWCVLLGCALLIAMSLHVTWFQWRMLNGPMTFGLTVFTTRPDPQSDSTVTLLSGFVTMSRSLNVAAVVALLGGWTTWLVSWLWSKVRRPN